MIIDIHNHPDWHGHGLAAVLADMDACGIARAWLLSWECPVADHAPLWRGHPALGGDGPIPFARCVSYAERAPGRFVLGYAPDPRRPEAIDRLHGMIEIYGVRVCGELKLRMMADNPDALRLYRFCGRQRLPVIIHFDDEFEQPSAYPRASYWYGGGIAALERALRACPETVFLGHAPGFWAHLSGDYPAAPVRYPKGPVTPGGKLPALLRQYPNLYCDGSAGSGLGALARDPTFAREFLLEFQDRYLFARDQFDTVHQDFLNGLGLPAPVLDKLFAGNALRLVPDPA